MPPRAKYQISQHNRGAKPSHAELPSKDKLAALAAQAGAWGGECVRVCVRACVCVCVCVRACVRVWCLETRLKRVCVGGGLVCLCVRVYAYVGCVPDVRGTGRGSGACYKQPIIMWSMVCGVHQTGMRAPHPAPRRLTGAC